MNACGKATYDWEKCALKHLIISIWRWLMVFSIESQHNSGIFLNFISTILDILSTLVVHFPGQASFECSWLFLTSFSILRAYWIVSAGPLGHLKQSIRKTFFEQCSTSTSWSTLKPKKLFCNCPNIVVTSFLKFATVLFFRRRPKSDQYRKAYRKTIKYETILDHARRP